MDSVMLLKEATRMCKSHPTCEGCPVREIGCDMPIEKPIEFVKAVEEWSAEHKVKTRLKDFREKYPNVYLYGGYPQFSPCLLGYCDDCQKCSVKYEERPYECWNMPLGE